MRESDHAEAKVISEGSGGDSGIAFELRPPSDGGAWVETALHRFIGDDDAGSDDGLTWCKWGYLYGATWLGGKSYDGTVFEIQP